MQRDYARSRCRISWWRLFERRTPLRQVSLACLNQDGLADDPITQGNYREALNIAELAARKIGVQAPVELTLVYALLLAYPHPGMPTSELAANTKHARDMLDGIHETYRRARGNKEDMAALRGAANDPLVFVQLAKLWQTENLEKAVAAYQTAIEIDSRLRVGKDQSEDLAGLKMSNNLATLYMLQGNVDGAMQMYEQVVATLGEPTGKAQEHFRTTLLYNLGRAYEDSNDVVRASDAYQTLLASHPEYVNGESPEGEVDGILR